MTNLNLMSKQTIKNTATKLQKRVEKLEQANPAVKRKQVQTPAEVQQERFERTLESFNRDDKMRSLNGLTPEDVAALKKAKGQDGSGHSA